MTKTWYRSLRLRGTMAIGGSKGFVYPTSLRERQFFVFQ